jgi:hypothetical protein
MREGKMTLDPKKGTGVSLIRDGEAFQVRNFHQLPELSKAIPLIKPEEQIDSEELYVSNKGLKELISGKRG